MRSITCGIAQWTARNFFDYGYELPGAPRRRRSSSGTALEERRLIWRADQEGQNVFLRGL